MIFSLNFLILNNEMLIKMLSNEFQRKFTCLKMAFFFMFTYDGYQRIQNFIFINLSKYLVTRLGILMN
jgi:hypothetical protein